MTTTIKALLAPAAIAAMALSAAAPAMAQDGFGRGYGYGSGYGNGYGNGWGRGDNPRRAVEMCSRVAERAAARNGYSHANVFDVRDVRNTRWGFEVRGRIAVRDNGGWNNGWRGRNGWDRDRDTGSFNCRVERGRVTNLDIDGIRGL